MKRFVVVAIVLLAALGVWWGVSKEPSSPPVAPPMPADVPTPAKPVARTPRRASEAPVESARPAPPAEPKAESPPAPNESSGELTVVDAATGEALAGVQVAFLALGADPTKMPPAITAALEEADDPIEAVFAHGRTFKTDEHGRVALPKFEGIAVVAARHGELSGTTGLSTEVPGWRLELSRATTLSVLVVDAAGKPCEGVTAMLVHRAEHGSWPEVEETTDSAGAASLALQSNVGSDDSGSLALTVALPFAEPPSVAVDAKKPPSETVRLVLPPSGRVRCEVINEAGGAASDGQSVMLRVAADATARVVMFGRTGRFDDARAKLARGVALFPHVGLGLELEVEIAAPDASRVTVKQRFAGPRTAGEETVVRVTLGGRRPSVVGRLVDPKGAPLPGVEIIAGISEPGREVSHVFGGENSNTTDENGRFRFAFDRAPGDASSAKLELGRNVTTGGGAWSTRRIALVDLPAVLPAGDVDVGDVVYAGTALVLAGIVVDPSGKPLAGATVRAMETGRGAQRSPADGVDAVTTDAEGRFRLSGDVEGARKVLVGVDIAGWYVPNAARFEVGATDARIEMAEAGGIAGSVRVPEGVDQSASVIVSGPPADNGDGDYRFHGEGLRSLASGEGGRFEIRNLRPGKARVSIRLGWNDDDTILTVDEVEIVAGKVTRDPRLQDVDPAKSLHMLKITVRDAEKALVPGATVHFRPVGGDAFWKRADPTGADGVATVQARADAVKAGGADLVVTCPGFRSRAVGRVTADTEVLLQAAKASTVRVRLSSGCPIPDPPYHLAAGLAWVEPGAGAERGVYDDPRGLSGGGHENRFGKDRVVTFETYDAGRYRVELMLWKMDMSGGGGGGIETVPESVEVTVAADGASVEVEVGVDPEELKQRMDRKR